MNRLQHETSPYLLQHAHNPVDWYPWGEEALERAQAEDKPIIISIGYSTCHWCHVMERESFEDPSVANYMNEHFINIKVDREERPDLDQIYMEACQAMTGGGGWPLNCFLTPDGRPFYAGTYFPPQPAHNRPSWPQLLQGMAQAFHNKRDVVDNQAERLLDAIRRADVLFVKEDIIEDKLEKGPFTPAFAQQLFIGLKRNFDTTEGGFGGAPKFPGAMNLQYLLTYYYHSGEVTALEHVCFSLDKMIGGGIYDQIGGGFARYATDKAWLVPHFEKMLYDNALLVQVLSNVYKITGKAHYKTAIQETLTFVEREMTSEEGGFYAALDADSEGEEGKFYIWSYAELQASLGADFEWFADRFGVSPEGNWEGANILWLPKGCANTGVNQEKLAQIKKVLLEVRAERTRPGLDDKILLAWNALMNKAYSKAYEALGDESYKEVAIRNMEFLLKRFTNPDTNGLFHTYKAGEAKHEAFLDDYAFLIESLISLYEISFNSQYLDKASEISAFVLRNFLDSQHNLFYFTPDKQGDLPIRRKEFYDNATPSGNAVMAENLFHLGRFLDNNGYLKHSETMLLRLQESIGKYPTSFSRWARASLQWVYPFREIAVVGPAYVALATEVAEQFIPNKILMASKAEMDKYPLLRARGTGDDTNIFVCQNYSCRLPVKSLKEMMEIVENE